MGVVKRHAAKEAVEKELHNTSIVRAASIAALMASAMITAPAQAQSYSVPADLQAKIDSHPNVRRLTEWGGRPDWSPDGKRLLFISKEYGDLFELDVATGKSRPLTFHYSHDGIFRAYYLANGDIALTAPREHTPGFDNHGRANESELWILKADLSGPPVALGERNMEGIAVARGSQRIAWAKPVGSPPPRVPDAQRRAQGAGSAKPGNQVWIADIADTDGRPQLASKRMVMDCGAPSGALADLVRRTGGQCQMIEPQNFIPSNDDRLTFTMAIGFGGAGRSIGAYVLDLRTGAVTDLDRGEGYAEAEGVFPDGRSTLVEYSEEADLRKATHILDLWQFALDGSGRKKRVTRYNALDPSLKANQGVVSPDGRWMAFGVSTGAIEAKVAGQGIGIFLMDLKAAGF
jgi:hypothetical protein